MQLIKFGSKPFHFVETLHLNELSLENLCLSRIEFVRPKLSSFSAHVSGSDGGGGGSPLVRSSDGGFGRADR